MRVALYARYSSDLQDERSITDQLALARDHAARQGWQVVAEFSDAAISGSSMRNRAGLLKLIEAAKAQRFDAVLAESLDRLSRRQADMAALFDELTFYGVRIETLADGPVSEIHVGLKGTMSALFLKDLAQKTRRGQIGRVKAGRIPGGRCYGYDVLKQGDERGQRTINETEATIVRRIFTEYVGGRSPLALAADLNRERVPAPRGGQWNASTINGSRKRANGILSNTLYAGCITYNRQRFVKDPATGKRQARVNPRSEWLTQELLDLRIIHSELWEAAQARRTECTHVQLDRRRRPKHLLSGLVACGACGSSMIVVREDRVGCSSRLNKGVCTNRRTIRLSEIEQRVLEALKSHLMAPRVVEAAIEAYRQERQKLVRERSRTRGALERALGEVKRKLSRVVATVEAGGDPHELAPKLNALSAERKQLEAELSASRQDVLLAFHPNAAERYAAKVADIHAALLKSDEAAREAVVLVRELVERIIVTPTADGADGGRTRWQHGSPGNGTAWEPARQWLLQAPATNLFNNLR